MAERRMFAKTIIDSDAFLDMPLSTQALYFHLSMRADDEGFINNPKKIQRMIGASDDDLKVLASKNFIIPFESGIVVIKHWRIHNYIRADRLVNTKYTEERKTLMVKENGAYSICGDIKEIECSSATDMRKRAYEISSLPYSFSYKMKRAFEGHICPMCGSKMTSAYKTKMPTIQHNIPISKGGVHELENISVICESCNTSTRDKETGALNNADVIEMWDRITYAEKQKIKWFNNPEILQSINVYDVTDICQSSDGQVTDNGQTNVGIGKDRLGKDSIDKDIESRQKRKRFVPPTLEQVKEYCEERNNGIDPERFISFYESKGWMVGKNKMKDWKASVRSWERINKDQQKKIQDRNKFNQFEQNSYDWDKLENELLGE